MESLLNDTKDEMDEETYQKAIRDAWEQHDSQVESLQQEQQVSHTGILTNFISYVSPTWED